MSKIANGNHVVKKIQPIFDASLYPDLGYSLCDLSYHPSFEERVSSISFPGEFRREEQVRFTVNKCPELIKSAILYLKSKHPNLQAGQATVQRHLTGAGTVILERIPGLKVLNSKRRYIFEHGNEKDRLEFSGRSYSYGHRLSLTTCRITVYAWEWAGSKLAEISSDLGLHQEIVVTASLIAGLSTSERWVPARHRDLFFDETIKFVEWVEGL